MAFFYAGGVMLLKSCHQAEKLGEEDSRLRSIRVDERHRQDLGGVAGRTRGLCSHSEGP